MENYGTSYRQKSIKALGTCVLKINARYKFVEGGVAGYITITDFSHDFGKKLVLSTVLIPDGTVEQIKQVLNPMFDSLTISKDEEN